MIKTQQQFKKWLLDNEEIALELYEATQSPNISEEALEALYKKIPISRDLLVEDLSTYPAIYTSYNDRRTLFRTWAMRQVEAFYFND